MRRQVIALILVVLIIVPVASAPRVANAFPGEVMAAAVWSYIKLRIVTVVKEARKMSGDLAFKNALKVYLTKLAEDTAVWLASAGTGQKPLFITDPHYFTTLGNAAAGEFLDTLATSTFGIDVCKPTDLRTQFSVESAVRALIDPANWCQNQASGEQQAALTTDNFLIGESRVETGVLDLPITTNLPDAETTLGQLDQAVAECSRACSGDNSVACTSDSDCTDVGTCVDVDPYTPFDEFQCVAGRLFMPQVGCDPALGKEHLFSLGACADMYYEDTQQYRTLVDENHRLSLNLCSARRRVARCTASTIFANAEATGHQLTNLEFIPQFTLYYQPGENQIGQIMTLAEKAKDAEKAAKEADTAKRGNSDCQPVTDPVTGEVKTPASEVCEAAKKLAQDPSGSIFGIYTGSPVADAIGVFTNTLTKKLLERIFKKGLNPGTNPGNAQFANGQFISGSGGVAAARAQFASIAQPDISAGGPYDILNELTACPTTSPAPNNCAITEKFRSAIEQKLTVRQAIDQGLLQGDQPFGFDVNGLEPKFNQGLPYRSLLILRTHRVVPVGWELAAQYIRDVPGGRGNYSLNSVIAGFSQCSGATASQFCGLVDPDWVLKAPEAFCAKQGFGETIVSQQWVDHDGLPLTPKVQNLARQEVCVDEQACIAENADGSCKGYGSCLEEKPIWRLSGQSCDEQYASCETYVASNSSEVSYLANTVDTATCNADNAGCRWYCNEKDASGAYSCTETSGDKKYFTGAVQSCPGDAAGCTEFIKTTDGTNLTANSSFETRADGDSVDDGVPDTFPGWSGSGVTLEASSEAHSGGAGLRITGGGGSLTNGFDTGRALNGESYTVSMFAKSTLGCGGTFGLESSSGGTPYLASQVITLASGWQRYVVTLAYEAGRTYDSTAVTAFFTPDNGCIADVDDVQLEMGATFSEYKDYGAVNTTHLKMGATAAAPITNGSFEAFTGTADDGSDDTFEGWHTNEGHPNEHLQATGTSHEGSTALKVTVDPGGTYYEGVASDLIPVAPGTERIYEESAWIYVPVGVTLTGTWELHRHALIGTGCTVGTCHHYTVLNGDYTWTDTSIPHGVWVRKWIRIKTEEGVSNLKGFVITKTPSGSGSGTVLVDNLSFTEESTDILCTADDVGCDLYTSQTDAIPGVATDADICSSDAVGCRAFLEMPVTDNGTDTGYKDRTGYRCSENQSLSCATDADCPAGSGSCLPSVSLTPSSGETCSVANVGCEEYTNLDEVARGGEGKEYYAQIRACVIPPDDQKTFYTWIGSESTGFQLQAYNLEQAGDGSPNYVPGTDGTLCTEAIFHDPEDTRWSPDCRQFYDADLHVYYRLYSKTITVSDDCHPLRNSLDGVTYNSIPAEGVTCPASAVQCREYRGPSGFNSRTIVDDNFNDGDTSGWDGGTWSTRTLSLGGGSMAVEAPLTVATNSDLNVPSELTQGKTYILSFWSGATTSADSTISARFDGGAAAFAGTAMARFSSTTGEPEWNFYRIGPVTLDRAPDTATDDGDPADNLVIDGTSPFVIDNVKLIEVTENAYLIKNSYTICTGSENCDLYRKGDGTTHTLKSFTRLCSQEKIGCQAAIKTQNSDSPFSQTFEGGTGTVTVPGDEVQFVINTPEHACQSEYQGCTEVGSPVLGQDGVTQFNPVTLIDDPDTYATTLCRDTENGCSAFTNKRSGGQEYFKNPEPNTCEYKTVTVSGVQTTGWYKIGTSGLSIDDRCPISYPPPEGQPEGAPSSGQGWVGLCPTAQAGCTEYLDAAEPTNTTIAIDGGFELGIPFSDDGWNRSYCTDGDPTCLHRTTEDVTDTVHGGAKALHLASSDAGAHGGIYANIGIEHFTPGAEYDLSGWLRTQSAGALRVGPGYVEFHHRVGETFTFISAQSLSWYTAPTGLSEWTRFQTHFTVPKDTDPTSNSVRLWPVAMENAGEIWLDDVIIAPSLASYALEQNVDASSCGGVVDEGAGCHAFNVPENGAKTIDGDTRQGTSLTCPTTDGTCDANAVLKVNRDRECSKWLSCQSSMISTDPQTGQQQNDCLGVGNCVKLGENGQCAQFEALPDKVCSGDTSISCTSDADCTSGSHDYCRPKDMLTFDSPGTVDQIQNLSGISQVGMRWSGGTIEGYYPIAAMPEIGLGGAGTDLVTNGSFDDDGYAKTCTEATTALLASHWWEESGAGISIDEDSVQGCFDQLDENNVLKIAPTINSGGVNAKIGAGSRLTSGAQYTASFRIRYTAPPQPSDRVQIEIRNPSDALLVFDVVTPTTGWQSFILGPTTMPVHTSDQVSLVFRNTLTSTNTAFEIDDVSMKPVLELQSTPTRITRSCRAFPTEDATSCTFTDENNTTHPGWYGYCLERDPDNQNLCLSWFPVDLLSGEASAFGSFQSASYQGRRPLFYCAETEGRYSNASFDAEFGFSPPPVLTQGIRRTVKTEMDHSYGFDLDCGQMALVSCRDGGCRGVSGCDETVSFENQTIAAADGPGGDTQFYDYEIEKIVWTVQARSHDDWPANGTTFETHPSTDPNTNWKFTWGQRGSPNNYIAVQTNFSSANRNLESYTVSIQDDSGDMGGVWLTGIIYLREMCRAVVEVADGTQATPWQSRVNGDVAYSVPSGLNYGLTADLAPYGGIAAPTQPESGCGGHTISASDPRTWDSDCRSQAPGYQPLEVLNTHTVDGQAQARSGSPFSCKFDDLGGSNCAAGAMCRGGDYDATLCNSEESINNCYNNNGICVGLLSAVPVDRVSHGKPLLQRLWASSIAGWHWLFPGQGYTSVQDYTWPTPNTRCAGSPPQRPAYVSGSDLDICAVPPIVANLNIGAFPHGQSSGDVHLGSGGTITMYFNSNLDGDEEPLANIQINWGDGTVQSINWGHKSKSDPQQPHLFAHSYVNRGTYQPKVQLKDNWGWCTNGTARDDCDSGSWYAYNGSVIVD